MTDAAAILVGETEEDSWIKIDGRGDVFLSPQVKCLTEQLLSEDDLRLFIDLSNCNYMDSTFMGMLAGLAIKLRQNTQATLTLFGVNERNQESLEELGMDSLMEINPPSQKHSEQAKQVRFRQWDSQQTLKPNGELLLDCHQNLSRLSIDNSNKFEDVIKTLKK